MQRSDRVEFDYDTQRWKAGCFELPVVNGDYVILTPKEILTRDEAWINQSDMLDKFHDICVALPDEGLRDQATTTFTSRSTSTTKEKESEPPR